MDIKQIKKDTKRLSVMVKNLQIELGMLYTNTQENDFLS
jgi:hypothetical protein